MCGWKIFATPAMPSWNSPVQCFDSNICLLQFISPSRALYTKKMIFNSPTIEIPNPFSVAKLLYNSNYPSMIFAASIKYRGLHIPPIYHNLFYTIFCPFVLILSYNLSWGQLPFFSILKLDKTIFWCFNSKRNRASVKNLEILNNILKNIIHI